MKGHIIIDVGSKFSQFFKLIDGAKNAKGGLKPVILKPGDAIPQNVPAVLAIRPVLGEYDLNYYHQNEEKSCYSEPYVVVQDTLQSFLENPVWDVLR